MSPTIKLVLFALVGSVLGVAYYQYLQNGSVTG